MPSLPTPGASIGNWGTVLNQWLGQGGQVYDVKAGYGAVGDGVADDTAEIQSALDAARIAGGGIVYFPPGTYKVSLATHPVNSGWPTALVVGGNTHLCGASRDASVIQLAASQTGGNDVANTNQMLLNYHIASPYGDEQITISDLTFDGNAGNQTHTHNGVRGIGVRGMRHTRVRAKNCRGTATSGVNETFEFEVDLSTDVSYTDCEAIGTAGSTASGFSADDSSNIKYLGCIAFGMSVTNGFTHFACQNVQHTNCHSYLNASNGFNSEQSLDVLYYNCIAGGRSTVTTGYPYTASTSLGNQWGHTVNGSGRVHWMGSVSSYNTTHGAVIENVPSGTVVRVIGGGFNNNGNAGMFIADTLSATQTRIRGGPDFSGNTNGQLYLNVQAAFYSVFGNVAAPTVPATTVALTNPFPLDASVFVKPGASTCAVSIGGTATGLTLASGAVAQMVRLPAGQTITLTYTSAPTWTWFVD